MKAKEFYEKEIAFSKKAIESSENALENWASDENCLNFEGEIKAKKLRINELKNKKQKLELELKYCVWRLQNIFILLNYFLF